MRTLKTVLHTYDYDTNTAGHAGPAGEWTKLEIKLRHTPGRGNCMHALADRKEAERRLTLQAGPVELETDFLFENQWNATNGWRLFDWWLECVPDRPNIKRGHYLDITPEMIEIRRNTFACGYCGDLVPRELVGNGLHTANSCLGNVYLKESELHLCRLIPVCDHWKEPLKELSEEERAFLLPLYLEAQSKSTAEVRGKQRSTVEADYDKTVKNATTERDGFLWLLDHGMQTENCIYYHHTGRFSFGWRAKYEGKARETILALLAKFPFPYDVV